ncbi:hypothetical protein [Nostoc sp. FACHB-110]|uniref:hypothetical protein n=1 Tax=Nostoc sp. FACHB-110 TaxID=2692834 RepID=UPI00168710EC|nr:hypothetical protein [Nostoc sp. FACHB-110]MBD2439286.1 hypothetical protein [Nostoc sp. FACHB-110]
MKEIIENYNKELKNINENIKINFDNTELIKQQIQQLKKNHKRVEQIKKDINSELKNLNVTKFINQVGEFGNRGLEIAKGVGKTALGFKLRMAEIAIPLLSDVVSTIGDELLESGVEDIFNSKSDKDINHSREREIYLLLSLQELSENIINNINEISQLVEPCKFKLHKNKTIDLHEELRKILPSIRLDLEWFNLQSIETQLKNSLEIKNKLDSLHINIQEIIKIGSDNTERPLGLNHKYVLNSTKLEALVTKLEGYICGIKINSKGEFIFITYNKQSISLEKLISKYENLNKKVESLKLQTEHFQEFIKSNLTNNFYSIKRSLEEKNIDIQSAQYKIDAISKIVKLDLKEIKTKLIKQHIEQLTNVKEPLFALKEKIDRLAQTLKNCNTEFDIKPATIEKFISIFGKSLIGLEFHTSGEVILNVSSKKDKITDIYIQYLNVSKSIDNLIQEANQTILSANKQLKNKRILGIVIFSITLLISLSILVTATKRTQLQQLIAYLSIVRDTVDRDSNLKIEESSAYKVNQEKEIILTDIKYSEKLKNAQQLAMEASVIVQKPPHPPEVWQQAKSKWQKAISSLESIPQNSKIYPQAKDKLVLYRNNYNAINKTILIEQKALEDFKLAQQKAWQAALTVQDKPQQLTSLQQAQSNLSQAIDLLNSIPKSTFISNKANEKINYYRSNYKVINSKIQKLIVK